MRLQWAGLTIVVFAAVIGENDAYLPGLGYSWGQCLDVQRLPPRKLAKGLNINHGRFLKMSWMLLTLQERMDKNHEKEKNH